MVRSPCCDGSINGVVKKGAWTPEEDKKLVDHIRQHGHGRWRSLPKSAGLNRCGKSCRLRWTNYLRPDIKRGNFSDDELRLIVWLHSVLGNKWSVISTHLPGRTDNEIKNYWNTHLKKKLLVMGIDPVTHRRRPDLEMSARFRNLLAGDPSAVTGLVTAADPQFLGSCQVLQNPLLLQLMVNPRDVDGLNHHLRSAILLHPRGLVSSQGEALNGSDDTSNTFRARQGSSIPGEMPARPFSNPGIKMAGNDGLMAGSSSAPPLMVSASPETKVADCPFQPWQDANFDKVDDDFSWK